MSRGVMIPERLVPVYVNSALSRLTSSCDWYRDFTTEAEQGDDIAGDLWADNNGSKPMSVLRYRAELAGHDSEIGCDHADVRRVPGRGERRGLEDWFCVDCGGFPVEVTA